MNFQDALTVKVGDIEEPPMIPQGTYIVKVNKPPVFGKTNNGDYETCDFTLGLIQATDNVPPEDLEEYGDITTSSVKKRFMFHREDEVKHKQSLASLRRFIEDHLQVDGARKMELKQALADTVNHQCLVDVSWRPNPEEPSKFFPPDAGKTAPVV